MRDTTRFVAACCRWPQTEDTKAVVAQAAADIADWDAVPEEIARHRVIPLVHLAVKDLPTIPKSFRDWAAQRAQEAAHDAMRMTRECLRIDATFKAARIAPLHFKGPTLAQIAYGSVALKVNHDLDIFVPASDIPTAVALLEAEGYRVPGQVAPLTARQLSAIARNVKDLALIGPNGTLVELHWRFVHSKSLLTDLETALQREGVTVATSACLDTLSTVQMLHYLCVHGALHHWKRLKWLADLSAFLEQLPEAARAHAIAEVRQTSGDVALEQALKLCDTLLGTRYAPHLSERAQRLYAYALPRLEAQYLGPRRFGMDVGIVQDLMATRHIYPSLWAAIVTLNRLLVRQDDVLALPLPAALNWMYVVIRLPALLLRRLQRQSP